MGRLVHFTWTDFRRRTLAAGCAVLILTLGLLATSPSLHGKLHAGPHATLDDGCAVALFATGVSVALPLVTLPPAMGEGRERPGVTSQEVLLGSPRYLLRPERGPPVG